MNSLWLVITALAAFLVAYRLYGAFLAARVAVLNDKNITPAASPPRRHRLSAHPAWCCSVCISPRSPARDRWWARAGVPMGVFSRLHLDHHRGLPGRRGARFRDPAGLGAEDGLSLPKIARELLGPISGVTTTLATLFIIIATLAGVAKVVVNALSESSWGMFTIVVTIPAALMTGLWMNKIRPGRVGEASLIGVTSCCWACFSGKPFADSAWRHCLLFSKPTLRSSCPFMRPSPRSCRCGCCCARGTISVRT